MKADPAGCWPTPTRRESRGLFPEHTELPGRRVLTLAEARTIARDRLEQWRAGRYPDRTGSAGHE
jgi:hypothetical protein